MSFLGSLVDSFTGKSARKDIDKGIAAVGEGRDKAIGAITGAGTEAQGYLQPYREQGTRFNKLWGDAYGVNGADARTSAEDLYNSDDMLGRNRAYDLSRAGRTNNASGNFSSGTAALADSRIRMKGYGDWVNGLERGAGQGQQAATNSASIAQNTGNQVGNVWQGYGNSVTGLYQNRAQTENALAQNIIGTIGAVGTYFGGKPAPQGGGQSYSSNNIGDYFTTKNSLGAGG